MNNALKSLIYLSFTRIKDEILSLEASEGLLLYFEIRHGFI